MKYANFDTAVDLYKLFMEKYAKTHTYNGKNYSHSIPSSYVYSLVKSGNVWLLSLIMGVASYSVYFDDSSESSQVISRELLDKAGVKDPCLSYKSSITPWTGTVGEGKSPWQPVDKLTTGLGIAHMQKGGLEPFYKSDPITATLPVVDEEGNIQYNDKSEMLIDTYTFCYQGKPLYGWGMEYGNGKRLSLDCITTNTSGLCYCDGNNRCYVKGKLHSANMKLIGPSYGKKEGSSEYMSQSEASAFREWCNYHFNIPEDSAFVPLSWMAHYWAPYFSWHKGTQVNSLASIMLASSAKNSGGFGKELNGLSPDAIIDKYLKGGNDKEHRQRRVVNTQRAIALATFIYRE